MTTSPLAMLDQSELLQLAISSGQRNDAASSLIYLKEAVSRDDASPNAYLLLGAEYAEIGLYERAISAMEMALQMDPALPNARLQLGLLVLSSGDGAKAETILRPLAEIVPADAQTRFASGLIHLIHDEFDAALNQLTQGMAQNLDNPAMNQNMQKIVDGINQLPPEVREQAAAKANEAQLQHVMLSAYTGTVH